MISPTVLSILLKFFFFGLLGGVKGQKVAQNEKEQLRLSHTIPQKRYRI